MRREYRYYDHCNNVSKHIESLDNGRFEASATGDQFRRVTVDLSSMTSINNNASFGMRVVAAHYRATGEFRQTATPASVATAGTWRFDNVMVAGTPIVVTPTVNLSVNPNTGTEAKGLLYFTHQQRQ